MTGGIEDPLSDVESFPRMSARTQRFTLGAPRNFSVSGDGTRVVFLRSASGTDRGTMLWVADVGPDGIGERVVADPAVFGGHEELSATERARRERSREGAGGIVGYVCDGDARLAAFTWSGRLFVVDLVDRDAQVRELPAVAPVVDPRPDPTGSQIAYVSSGTLRMIGIDGSGDRAVATPDGPEVTWGLAEFVAAEEMGRHRGFWWAPDGSAVLAARVDTTPVGRWHITDPAHPARTPAEIAYPAAGTANAKVSLHVFPVDGGNREITWDRTAYEYLAAVHWSKAGPPLLNVLSRDQRRSQILAVDLDDGSTTPIATAAEEIWVDLVDGVPAWRESGGLLTARIVDGQRSLVLGENQVLSGGLYFRSLVGIGANERVLFTASEPTSPEQVHVWRTGPNGLVRLTDSPGVHSAVGAGKLSVISSAGPDFPGRRTVVRYDGEVRGEIASLAEIPPVNPAPRLICAGPRAVRTVLLLPTDHMPGTPLPVLMDPYGGPHAQRVLAARNAFGEAQWWADQGFAVIVADGRGTPGRDQMWEWAVSGDLAAPVLEDQIDALHAAAAECPDLDLTRVGIRGWSFGGYLAALAVLLRPDVFSAAIAGAPVTDWALYDTHYTERYLGTPQGNPEAYARTSLVTDGELTPMIAKAIADASSGPTRPLLLVHGLADDNVVAAHTLQLSAALLAAGRPHQVLPLSGVTHMTPQEVVAENLLLFQLDFLRNALER